jgi:hypothetical protein
MWSDGLLRPSPKTSTKNIPSARGNFGDTDSRVWFVSPLADLVAKRQAELKKEQA